MSTKKSLLRRVGLTLAVVAGAGVALGLNQDIVPVAEAQGVDIAVTAVDGAPVYDFPDNQDHPTRDYPVLDTAAPGTKIEPRCVLIGDAVARNDYTTEVGWVVLNGSPSGVRSPSPDHRSVIPAALVSTNVSSVPACPENKTFGLTDQEYLACVDLFCPEVLTAKDFADAGRNRIVPATNGGADDRNDAAHHCLWQLHMAVFAGPGFAKKVGDAHETVAGTAASHAMDFHNNEVARNLAGDERITAALASNGYLENPALGPDQQAVEQAVLEVCATAVNTAVHVVYLDGQTGDAALMSVDHTEHAGDTASTESTEGHLVYLEG